MAVTFYISRHGETIFNVMNHVQGWCDTPLTSRGRQSAEALGRSLAGIELDSAYASDSGRAYTTLNLALEARACKREELGLSTPGVPICFDERLREWCYGDLEGQPAARMQAALIDCFGADLTREEQNLHLPEIADYFVTIDTSGRAESFDTISKRLRSFIQETAVRTENEGGSAVLVVTHAFVIKTLVSLYAPSRVNDPVKIANASLTELVWDNGMVEVKRIGDTSMLS